MAHNYYNHHGSAIDEVLGMYSSDLDEAAEA